ncbi:MAG: hypothetical protein GYB68_04100 [Chloroflexi bacterium]|nr:hypothetical protein [Chloroflexota bacterium]
MTIMQFTEDAIPADLKPIDQVSASDLVWKRRQLFDRDFELRSDNDELVARLRHGRIIRWQAEAATAIGQFKVARRSPKKPWHIEIGVGMQSGTVYAEFNGDFKAGEFKMSDGRVFQLEPNRGGWRLVDAERRPVLLMKRPSGPLYQRSTFSLGAAGLSLQDATLLALFAGYFQTMRPTRRG